MTEKEKKRRFKLSEKLRQEEEGGERSIFRFPIVSTANGECLTKISSEHSRGSKRNVAEHKQRIGISTRKCLFDNPLTSECVLKSEGISSDIHQKHCSLVMSQKLTKWLTEKAHKASSTPDFLLRLATSIS